MAAARRRLERELAAEAWGKVARIEPQIEARDHLTIEPPTTVYLLYGADDVLLYVGISGNIGSRFLQHAAQTPWWAEVERADYHHLPTRSMAERIEKALIWQCKPRYNLQHGGGQLCRICVLDPVEQKGRCHACHNYFYRTGRERSSEMIRRALARRIEQRTPPKSVVQQAARALAR